MQVMNDICYEKVSHVTCHASDFTHVKIKSTKYHLFLIVRQKYFLRNSFRVLIHVKFET